MVDCKQLKTQLQEQCTANSKLRHTIARLEGTLRRMQEAAETEVESLRSKLMESMGETHQEHLKLSTINQQQTKLIALLQAQVGKRILHECSYSH